MPWHRDATYRMPVRVWRELMDRYFPNSGWLRLQRETLDALMRFKARRALPPGTDARRAARPDRGGAAVTFDRARTVADAVLYEGYVLYPYRASARKNQMRWQFGIAAPRAWSEAGGCEPWWMQSECLADIAGPARLIGTARFLHAQERRIEVARGGAFRPVDSLDVDGTLWTTWDEAVERTVDFALDLGGAAARERVIAFDFPAGRDSEEIRGGAGDPIGRCVRERQPVSGLVRIAARPVEGAAAAIVHVRVENVTPSDDPSSPRDAVVRASFLGLHVLLAIDGGAFVSLIDPPAWARDAAASCVNVRSWPVLVGDDGARDVVLASPIILYDYPQIAPESPGDLYDATEIDEILTLRTLTLTEEEKREARATDPRAAAIIDRVTTMPPEMLDRLHGAMRYLRAVTGPTARPTPTPAPETAPWWDPGADASVDPETDRVEVDGVAVAKGSRVRLRPGARRADAQDMFLAGRTATVAGVYFDVEQHSYLAVTVDADPAADLYQWHGRYLYFAPDEVEPLEAHG